MSALSGAQHLAGSGRTSFPIDKALPRDAYRVLGYRQCGERAVRVDILERLADLIRPALSWRETSPGQKPAGAFDGRGFVVTQAMTSLTGSAGEDFASILRALGYRRERRRGPPPKPVVVEAAAAEPVPAEAAVESRAEAVVEAVPETGTEAAAEIVPAVADAVDTETPPSAALLPDVAFSAVASESEPTAVEAKSDEILPEPAPSIEPTEMPAAEAPQDQAVAEAPQDHAVAEATPDQAVAEATPETVMATDAAAADTSTTAAAPDAVAEMVEVWRPGGRSEERRPRHDRARHRHHDRPQEGAAPAVAAGETGEAPKAQRHRPPSRERSNDFLKPRPDATVHGATASAAEGAPARQ